MFLLRISKFDREKRALELVEKTLQQMYRGGIFDHIGYGFSRYSTDNKWLAPHFEKMLYDNALLVMVYLEAYQVTGRELYRSVAEKTLEYIQREMTDETGRLLFRTGCPTAMEQRAGIICCLNKR